jgi:GNAT superfamily N-acetyltransferase
VTAILIRRFDPARDAEALRACIIDQQDFHRSMEPSWPTGQTVVEDYLAHLETACAVHDGCILIADCAGQPAGFACIAASTTSESPDDPAPCAWIYDVFVRPEYRRRRVASALMAEAERFARSRGAHTLRLGVQARNEHARGFYASCGFREYACVLTKSLDLPGL